MRLPDASLYIFFYLHANDYDNGTTHFQSRRDAHIVGWLGCEFPTDHFSSSPILVVIPILLRALGAFNPWGVPNTRTCKMVQGDTGGHPELDDVSCVL